MHVNINKIRKYIQKEMFITKIAIKAVKIIKLNKKNSFDYFKERKIDGRENHN